MSPCQSPITNNPTDAIDFHCHLLPNLDDGPATLNESVEMARALARAGYRQVYCTPHLIKGVYDAGNDAVRNGTEELQLILDREGIDLRLVPGREYYLDEFFLDYLKEPLPLGDTGLLLIEIPNAAPEKLVKNTLYRLQQKGFTPLIAHPERCRLLEPKTVTSVQWKRFRGLFSRLPITLHQSEVTDPTLLLHLIDSGCQFQGNLGSFTGHYGEKVRHKAAKFLAAGIYTHFGSDLHSVQQRDILCVERRLYSEAPLTPLS